MLLSLLCNGYDVFSDNSNSPDELVLWENRIFIRNSMIVSVWQYFQNFRLCFIFAGFNKRLNWCKNKVLGQWITDITSVVHETWKHFILRVYISALIWRRYQQKFSWIIKRKSLPTCKFQVLKNRYKWVNKSHDSFY